MRWPAKVRVITPGKIKFSFIREGVAYYEKRLKNYLSFALEEKKVPKTSLSTLKQKEGEVLLKATGNAFIVALDERGKIFTSQEFARKLESLLNREREVAFVLGGAYGLSEEVLKRADLKLSLSLMTFGHEIALLVFCEQLYRALAILSGEPYHK
ncbi:23S rRNA (pseudouridine(1915)-N(3))-methyltransferase RlmH [Thermodesulfatator atlanticus]|uniref:23S rRNA (pseudouridine(1915)-N(3))-methyltransferase RlmH n=1 Tax=Thermodesulfatator atlanticus TaxID=501497 RepID=UPI0003B5C663|nr:23S rRNA (pseudouridine(1915)-N(3))-methyltransferase RlmH [Thermodesulfatator atlanticus]